MLRTAPHSTRCEERAALREMARRLARLVTLGLGLWVAASPGGCSSPETSAGNETPTDAQRRTPAVVERFTYEAETGRVSALGAAPAAAPEVPPGPAPDLRAPRIVYVHGTPGSAGAFRAYLSDLVDDLPAVSVDRPGFGESEPESPVVSLVEQAAALEPLLVDRPVLVGHSLGGPIIAMAAALWPDRVSGLVILAGSLDPELEELRWYNRVGEVFDGLLSREMSNSNEEILALEPELRALQDRLHRVRCPVVIIHGTDDELVPYENVRFMEEQFSGAASLQIITLEGVSHFFIWQDEHIPAVRRAIEQLLLLDRRSV